MAWPIDEAQKIPTKDSVLFETGYGPSGLPHIGTFAEVLRTTWVRRAFEKLTGLPTKLIAFSDDMDGMRRVPDNVPNRELLQDHIGLPLTCVPDPFETHRSFAEHNNSKLIEFLDQFGFDYEFVSSTQYYRSGKFDTALLRVLECHDEIVDVIRPTLGNERAESYSPLMPIHPLTGHVMQVPIEKIDPKTGIIVWNDGNRHWETLVTHGHCKLQWKADWAMRWYALGVDYEMSGKDLIESVKLSGKICKILGGTPPINLTYELFLDENGQKISKSKGNGVTIEQWLRYGLPESLAYYLFSNPQREKKLYLGLIPKITDEYLQSRAHLIYQNEAEHNENPAWYVHNEQIPELLPAISFTMLLNLASVANTEDSNVLMAYVRRYAPYILESDTLRKMIEKAIYYYTDIIKPKKVFREPTIKERKALEEFIVVLKEMPSNISSDDIQIAVFNVGKKFPVMKQWFDCLYHVLLGQKEGPRFGVFIELYGIENTIKLIQDKLGNS
jgi:lysyl-tRNA synthetase class 1